MGNELQLDTSAIKNINNAMRRRAAITVTDQLQDSDKALLILLMLGLCVPDEAGGYQESGADQNPAGDPAWITWSRHREIAHTAG